MDLLIKNGRLPSREGLVDIGIKDGKFQLIGKDLRVEAKKEIDAEGKLMSPPFVESHVHLDSALNAGKPRSNMSGSLLEAIDIWGDRREELSKDIIKENAKKTIGWLMANGVLKIRSHVDASEKKLMTLKALLEVKEEMKDYIDLQLVAFPQDGIFAYEGNEELMVRALEMGADVIGGMPHVEAAILMTYCGLDKK